MTKQEFFDALRGRLSGLPKQELEERLAFYGEVIDDRVEEGQTEEEAVSELGSVEEIAAQIIAEVPLVKIAKEKIKPKRKVRGWEILLLVLGAPIWLSLGVAALSVILSLYVVLWSVIVSLWAVFAALVAVACGGAFMAVGQLSSNPTVGLAMLGAGLVCAGLSIFLFWGCDAATRGLVLLTKKIALEIKKCFVGKEKVA